MTHVLTPRRTAAAILIAGFAGMLAWNAPGQMSWDSVLQLSDGRSGVYNSWHPPIMAWLLGLFDSIVPGTALFLFFQSGLLLGALLALLWLRPHARWPAALAALLIVLTPQWLLYQGEIWKDILFADAAIAGFAALALAASKLQKGWLAAAALLLTLAACTRQNAIVLLPLAALALGVIARRHGRAGWIWGLSFLVITLGLGSAVTLALASRGDGGAGAAAQIRLGQSYDLAGALARKPALPLTRLAQTDKNLETVLRSRGPALYSPLRNDPFAADPLVSQAIADAPQGAIGAQWRALIVEHPGLYLHTRLADFVAVLMTPDPLICHFAPVGIDGPADKMKALGLSARVRPRDKALAAYARLFFTTPIFAHLTWGLLALVLLGVLLRRGGDSDLAVAMLLASALVFTLTFVMVSLACDYRYLVFLDLSAMAAGLYVAAGPLNRPRA